MERDLKGGFAEEFFQEVAKGGRLGIAMPAEYGGAGLNTTKLKVKAERAGDKYIVSGKKVLISTAQVADHMLLLARTTPIQEVVVGFQDAAS